MENPGDIERSSSKRFTRSGSSMRRLFLRNTIKESTSLSDEDSGEISFRLSMKSSRERGDNHYTGSLTPYRMVRPLEVPAVHTTGYRILRVWCLFRHAIRLPTEKTVDGMKTVLYGLKNFIVNLFKKTKDEADNECYSKNLAGWKLHSELVDESEKNKNVVDSEANKNVFEKPLSRMGEREMFDMGNSFRSHFREILPDELDETVLVKFTDCSRTRKSAYKFIEGMFGEQPNIDHPSFQQVPAIDKQLKYDTACKYWRHQIKKSAINKRTKYLFLEGEPMKQAVADVKTRCGFPDLMFGAKDLILVYESCCFESAWVITSPWCDLLSVENLKVLEYMLDLEFYTDAGYGNDMNTKIPCILFKLMIEQLVHSETTKAFFNFTHLAAILKFMAHLGLYEDENIMSPFDYSEEAINRKWRTSQIGTFSTNLCFILYEKNDGSEKAIRLMHQEVFKHIPGCPVKTDLLCPLDEFLKVFDDSINKCHYDAWCSEKKKKTDKLKTDKRSELKIDEKAQLKRQETIEPIRSTISSEESNSEELRSSLETLPNELLTPTSSSELPSPGRQMKIKDEQSFDNFKIEIFDEYLKKDRPK